MAPSSGTASPWVEGPDSPSPSCKFRRPFPASLGKKGDAVTKTAVGVAAMVVLEALMLTGGAAPTEARPAPTITIVLHVTDRGSVPADVLSEAKRQVTEVYAGIGVTVVWTEGSARLAPVDDALHLDVMMLSRDEVQKKCLADHMGDHAFGSAYGPTRRANVFFGRIADHATRVGADASLFVALVIAHEVGHLLLPALSHSSFGIMRAQSPKRLTRMPRFTGAQGTTIRARLATRGNERTQ
jgi:hypothetical protein